MTERRSTTTPQTAAAAAAAINDKINETATMVLVMMTKTKRCLFACNFCDDKVAKKNAN